MALPIYVSIHRRERGAEVIHDFSFASVGRCEGCFRSRRNTLTPVEMMHDDCNSVSPVGAPLCKACGLSLPLLDNATRATWPADLTALDVESLWDMVRKEQVAQALELGRADASATGRKGFNSAPTALEQARANQGSDRFAEVSLHA